MHAVSRKREKERERESLNLNLNLCISRAHNENIPKRQNILLPITASVLNKTQKGKKNGLVLPKFLISLPVFLSRLPVQPPTEEMQRSIPQPITSRERLFIDLRLVMTATPPCPFLGEPRPESGSFLAICHKIVTVGNSTHNPRHFSESLAPNFGPKYYTCLLYTSPSPRD